MKRIVRIGLIAVATLGLAGCHGYGHYIVKEYHHSYHGHGYYYGGHRHGGHHGHRRYWRHHH